MGYQIIKQPDGLLCIWSSYSDRIVASDATPEETINWFVDLAVQDARRNAERIIDYVQGERPEFAYGQFVKTWPEVRSDYYRFRREHDASLC